MYFIKIYGFCSWWCNYNDSFRDFLFFFVMVLTLDSFILKWQATAAAELNLFNFSL